MTHLKKLILFLRNVIISMQPLRFFWRALNSVRLKYLHFCNTNLLRHLFRTSAQAQARFFRQRFSGLQQIYWQVSESGWPYSQGGWLKRQIAGLAYLLGGKKIITQFGNRFQSIFHYQPY